jgi:hypothetical protein
MSSSQCTACTYVALGYRCHHRVETEFCRYLSTFRFPIVPFCDRLSKACILALRCTPCRGGPRDEQASCTVLLHQDAEHVHLCPGTFSSILSIAGATDALASDGPWTVSHRLLQLESEHGNLPDMTCIVPARSRACSTCAILPR